MSKKFKGGIPMLDAQGRIIIPSEQLEKVDGTMKERELSIYFDSKRKRLKLRLHPFDYGEENSIYYIATYTMDKKGRISIPKVIRKAFPDSTYLPAERDGEIYILIIEHEKKSE